MSKYHSWEIIGSNEAIKEADKSVFKYKGSGIPKETRWFWNIEKLMPGQKKELELLYNNDKYSAYILNGLNGRTRIFWHSNLGHKFNKYHENNSNRLTYIHFKKYDDKTYHIHLSKSFILYNTLEDDIDSEIRNNQNVYEYFSDYFGSEGQKKFTYSTTYERDPKNRAKCIEKHGVKCVVCNFDFEEKYGYWGKDYIEVHHKIPLYIQGEKQLVNPETDMVPVCSNCHRIIHRKKDYVLSIEELKTMISSK